MLAVNELTKRRQRITIRRASLDDGMADHESKINRLQNKSHDWNRRLMNSQWKKRRFDEGYILEEGDESDYDNRIKRNQPSNHNRNFATPGDAVSSPPSIRTVDEMVIGVSVPRKTRSASTKRLNTNWSFRNAGFGRGLSHHRRFVPSNSPPNLLRKNMKTLGPKPKHPKGVGDSSLVQDDIEIEVAEALFDLMNQTPSGLEMSKKNQTDPVCRTSGCHKRPVTNKISISTSHLPHKSGFLGRNGGLVKKGVGLSVQNDYLIAEDDNYLAWSKYSMMQSENSLPRSTVDVSVVKAKAFDKRDGELFNGLKRISSKKRVVAPQDEEFPLHANQNSHKQVDPILLEGNPTADLIETKREHKFQTDLMMKIADEVAEKEQEENRVEPSYLTQGSSKLEQYASTCSGRSELVELGEEHNQCKALFSGHKFALPTSLSFPIFGAGWARDLPHPGFMPPFQRVWLERNASSLTALPVFMQHPPWQQRRKRCATHQYIAHNILCHQKLTMNLKRFPATDGPASIYKDKAPRRCFNIKTN